MKKIIFILTVIHLPLLISAQVLEKQTVEGIVYIDTVAPIIPVDRQELLKNVDVIFNSRFAYNSHFSAVEVDPNDGEGHDYSHFNIDQLRLEIKGKIHDKVYFRFRNRYTRGVEVGSIDNISRSVDLAFARIDLSPRTNFSLGKLCADWGGYEFDFNPIDILTYNDLIEYADNFLVGAGISHALKSNKHSFSFQILNSRNRTFEDQYGSTIPPDVNASEYPLALVGNWRGSFLNGKFETTWSYSFFNEAEGKHMSYIALGNKFKPSNNFVLYYDFHYSWEGFDRLGITSGIINNPEASNPYPYAAEDALYIENWIRAEYMVSPKINLLLTVMNSNHLWKDNPYGDADEDDLLSTSYGIIPTVQYFPFKDHNMKFYLGYVYRKYDFTSYAENRFAQRDYTTGLLSFGIICPFLVL